jgi:hypothetical protein
MIVIGGTYTEHVERPRDSRMRGSGLRAAIALRSLVEVELHTLVGDAERPELEATVDGLGIGRLVAGRRSGPVSFSYFTPLSPPEIEGRGAVAHDAIDAKADVIMRFGLLEANASTRIEAGTLVVDPQGGTIDQALEGATFDRLAVVANEREILSLSGSPSLEEASRVIADRAGAAVVVVKCGARGARVFAGGGERPIAPYPTDRVVPIGSGDVFAAGFAWAYGVLRQDAADAARYASRAASEWCGRGDEPALTAQFDHRADIPFFERPAVYLAGPFRGLSQQWLTDLTRTALLELGAKPFSPFHDVGFGGPEVAQADLEGLHTSRSMLALLDEFDPGTLFEIGYAIKQGMPIVGYLDPHTTENLVMLEGTGVEVVPDLSSAVYRAIWKGSQAH